MNITPIHGNNLNLDYFNKNQQEEKKFDIEIQANAENEIIDYRKLSNEESKNLYYAYKTTNLMKSKIEIFMNLEENELTYKDIRDIKKSQNRVDLINYYNKEVNIQKNDSKYEVWA